MEDSAATETSITSLCWLFFVFLLKRCYTIKAKIPLEQKLCWYLVFLCCANKQMSGNIVKEEQPRVTFNCERKFGVEKEIMIFCWRKLRFLLVCVGTVHASIVAACDALIRWCRFAEPKYKSSIKYAVGASGIGYKGNIK